MTVPVHFFCHWTAEFSVEFVPPVSADTGGLLRFSPRRHSGRAVRREWFKHWFQHSLSGKAAAQPVNLLLRLASFGRHDWSSEAFQAELQSVARDLGPLFSLLPGHRASEAAFLEESVEEWWSAAQSIQEIGRQLERLPKLSRDGSKTARNRRALQAGEAVYPADWEALSPQKRRQFSAAYRAAPGISPRHLGQGALSELIDQLWFPRVELPGVDPRFGLPHLRLDEDMTTPQLNVPTGMQALLLMALQDQRLGRSLLLRECARPTCRTIAFMSPRQRYCSDRCRNAAGVQRHAQKKKRQASAHSARRKK